MDSTSEHDFVQRLKDKSPDAFEELITRYARRLYSVAFRVLRNPADAEDAVQETFLKTFQEIDAFREESSLYTWLYRIVSNVSLGKLRYNNLHNIVPIEPYLPKRAIYLTQVGTRKRSAIVVDKHRKEENRKARQKDRTGPRRRSDAASSGF